jgi:hypothetical protein
VQVISLGGVKKEECRGLPSERGIEGYLAREELRAT